MKKAIVIGSGIGGLATSLRLARQRNEKGDPIWSVEVFEQAEGPGGKLTYFEQNGFRFDAGPSLFTLPHLIEELVTLSGESLDTFPYIELDRSCHYFWEDGTKLIAWADKQRLAAEIETVLGVDPAPTLKHLEHSAFLYDKTAALFMERSLHKAKSYFSKEVLKALFAVFRLDLTTSMHKANTAALNHPKLIQLFNRYATYNGSDPYRAPGVLNIIPHLEHNIGTFFPKGGMYNITQTVYQLALNAGVTFHFNTPVQQIHTEKKRAVAIDTPTGKKSAQLIVSNADVFTSYKNLLPQHSAPEKIINSERSSSALIFYWGITAEFDQLHLHNILFSDDYAKEFAMIKEGNAISEDPTVYINITSKCEPNDVPKGCENWFVMINVPANKGQDWDTLIPKARKQIVAKINRVLNTNIEALITNESILEPRTIESKTSSYMGALYGTASNDRMAAFLRHPNFSRSIKGLYFCGGSVHPGGGIPLCLLSARIVSDLINEDYG